LLPGFVRAAWALSHPLALVAAWTWGLIVFGPLHPEFTVAHLAYRVLPPTCAVWAGLTVILCLVVQVLRRGADRIPG
jgi:hypothetical protein